MPTSKMFYHVEIMHEKYSLTSKSPLEFNTTFFC